jgi:cullin 1
VAGAGAIDGQERSRGAYPLLIQTPVHPGELAQAEQRLTEEEARVSLYLHPSTLGPLIKCTETALVADHAAAIQAEFQSLLIQNKEQDLLRMFNLLSRIPGSTDPLKLQFEQYVLKMGLEATAELKNMSATVAAAGSAEALAAGGEEGGVASGPKRSTGDDPDPKTYVECLLRVHGKFDKIAQASFKGDPGFVAALDKACREFVNRNSVCTTGSSKSPELLAKFCDALLRKSSKSAEEVGVEDILTKVVSVLACVRTCVGGCGWTSLLTRNWISTALPGADDCLQVRRGQGRVPKVLLQNAGQASGQ